jgi:hypothetical protein
MKLEKLAYKSYEILTDVNALNLLKKLFVVVKLDNVENHTHTHTHTFNLSVFPLAKCGIE